MSTTSDTPSKGRSSSDSHKTEPAAAENVTAAEIAVSPSPSAQPTTELKSAAGGGKRHKQRSRPASPRRLKRTKSKKQPRDGASADAGATQSEVASCVSVAATLCSPLYSQDTTPPASGAPSRAEVGQPEASIPVAVPVERPASKSMPVPSSSPAAHKVMLLYPASSLTSQGGAGRDANAAATRARNAEAASSEVATVKSESAPLSRRRETSLPNLMAVPGKSAMAGRRTPSLSMDKRARFRDAPIIELVLLSLTQLSSGKRNAALTLTAAAAASATIVLAAIIVYALFVHSDAEEDAPEPAGCTSSDCRHHAALITNRLNLSLDPCHDFAAFACSAWSPPPTWLHREFPSARDDVVLAWARDFENTLVTGSRYLPTGEMAKLMFRACAYDTTAQRDTSALRVLRRFMTQRGIPWPSKLSSPTVRPLGVLIDLAFKWQVPLWFTVRFARRSAKPGGSPPAVIIGPSSYTLVWFSLHRDIVRRGSFEHHWRRLHDALSDSSNASDFSARRAQNMADVDSTVLGELANALTNGSRPSDDVALRYVSQEYTPNISYTEWQRQLQKHVLPVIDGNHLLRVSNSAILSATDGLFSRFTEATLLENMGWFFARLFAPLADPSLLRDRHGAPHTGEEELFCAAQVEALFRLLVISLYTVPRFSPTLREEINQLLHAIREMVADKVSALAWLDEASKLRAEEKLREMGTVLWPPDNMMDNVGLAVLYSKFRQPSGPSWTVVDAWVQYREAINDLEQEERDMVLQLPANMELPLVEYDYLRNEVRVSVQALSRPVFYFEGTRAMFYGGLGFLYAAEVVRALDADGARRDASGVLVTNGSWLSPTWTEAVADREECLPESGGFFPEIPAVEVAYASLEKALVSSGERLRTARSAFSQRRLFYVTLCYLMCTNQTLHPQRRPFAGDCNKAVANFPRFAEDFGCSTDARMRRERPCVFFG
ncbi:hypothetical protein HPB49_011754 [Dermacentor silvarum]|uniref:Uncharacterized protein n=1 Tax=Dermacentor silvarum TaxID=543639 RepID=A0ACB8DCP0_DERSI|nr:hypothetical protein HPB49_011754 [Dermacentor silvarum]